MHHICNTLVNIENKLSFNMVHVCATHMQFDQLTVENMVYGQ